MLTRKMKAVLSAYSICLLVGVASLATWAQTGNSIGNRPHPGNDPHQIFQGSIGQMPVYVGPNAMMPAGPSWTIKSVSGSYTIQASDWGKLIIETAGGSPIITFPQATATFAPGNYFGPGFMVYICSTGSTQAGLTVANSGHIDGQAWQTVQSGGGCNMVYSDGSTYHTLPWIGFYNTPGGGAGLGLSLQLPDGTATGGNARGAQAVDLQIGRSSASEVASGTNAFTAGYRNTASSNYDVAIGEGNQATGGQDVSMGFFNVASGGFCVAMGDENTCSTHNYGVAMGSENTASGQGGVAMGERNLANGKDCVALGFWAGCYGNLGWFNFGAVNLNGNANPGQNSYFVCVIGNTTTGSSAVQLTADGGAASTTNECNPAANTSMTYTADCSITDNTTHHENTYSFGQSLITKGSNAASTAMGTGNPTVTTGPTASAGSLTLQATPTQAADTTNGGINISYTPPAANTDRLYAMCRISGVTNPGN